MSITINRSFWSEMKQNHRLIVNQFTRYKLTGSWDFVVVHTIFFLFCFLFVRSFFLFIVVHIYSSIVTIIIKTPLTLLTHTHTLTLISNNFSIDSLCLLACRPAGLCMHEIKKKREKINIYILFLCHHLLCEHWLTAKKKYTNIHTL